MVNVEKFSSGIVAVVVAVIMLVCVAVPVIAGNLVPSSGSGTLSNYATINSLLVLLPLLITVGIMIAVIAMFMKGKQ